MKKSINKLTETAKHRDKVNPGHKQDKYVPPLRPRAVVFKPKTVYNRASNRRVIKEAMD